MTPRERLDNLLSGRAVDRPPFFPAIYDYKPALIGMLSHLFGRDEASVTRALRAEASELRAEILTSTYDIYNIEAEALGGEILWRADLAMPDLTSPLIHGADEIDSLPRLSWPKGRMGLFIGAMRALALETGASIPVRGGLSGPFSMAAKIYPREQLLIETLIEPEGVGRLLSVCNAVIKMYANGFIEAGAHGIAIFDSFIAPPMLSPAAYEDVVLPYHLDLFGFLKAKGVAHRTLVAGGNTLPLLPSLVTCGANQLILDYTISPEKANEAMAQYPSMLFRYNMNPALLCDGTFETVTTETRKILAVLRNRKNLILGTGILPLKTPIANILAVREQLISYFS